MRPIGAEDFETSLLRARGRFGARGRRAIAQLRGRQFPSPYLAQHAPLIQNVRE